MTALIPALTKAENVSEPHVNIPPPGTASRCLCRQESLLSDAVEQGLLSWRRETFSG
jgi:hypothetical protein